jgi:hypothetical protein
MLVEAEPVGDRGSLSAAGHAELDQNPRDMDAGVADAVSG